MVNTPRLTGAVSLLQVHVQYSGECLLTGHARREGLADAYHVACGVVEHADDGAVGNLHGAHELFAAEGFDFLEVLFDAGDFDVEADVVIDVGRGADAAGGAGAGEDHGVLVHDGLKLPVEGCLVEGFEGRFVFAHDFKVNDRVRHGFRAPSESGGNNSSDQFTPRHMGKANENPATGLASFSGALDLMPRADAL